MTAVAHGYETLIAVNELEAHCRDPAPDWLIVDCRFDLGAAGAGEAAWRSAHIPGALYAHLDRDLSGPRTPSGGRHPLPTPEGFAATLGRWGMSATTQVIVYDADNGAFAARLWWLLRWSGHRAVAVLDGGWQAWLDAGLPVNTRTVVRTPTQPVTRAERSAWLDTREVADALARNDWRLLDARAPERFAGRIEPIDPVAGHIPGAVNHPFSDNLRSDGRFAAPEVLRERFERSQAGIDDDRTIVMCGSGVTACHLLLALEHAGKPGARLYAGSWSEWIRDPSRPIAKG